MTSYFNILRPINCLIVGLTQYLTYYVVIVPGIGVTSLNIYTLSFLVLATVLLTGSGYVINDIIDEQIDRINKGNKRFVGVKLSVHNAWGYYYFLLILGFGLSLMVAYSCDEIGLIWIYPFMVGVLYLYSKYGKARAIWGNLMVSLFTAFVPGILLLAERQSIYIAFLQESTDVYLLLICMGAYMLFAFLSNLTRELIKDIEDIKGDRSVGLRTLPIVIGIRQSRMIALVYSVCILLFLFFFNGLFIHFEKTQAWLITSLVLLPMNLFIILKISKAKERSEFSCISNQLKVFMVLGLVSMLSISHFLYS